MANTARVTTLSTLKQRNLIDRAYELKALLDSTKEELDEILDQFKYLGDGDYAGRDGHKIQGRTTERTSLDSKIVKGLLTTSQLLEATKTTAVISAKVL